ncbi:hypothetical protein [Candidatus Neptunochlamydia vexilliferae]|uniref:TonB C-terminal domain-containing protein n=1 Tax=Candidatus Neptunichlamydia vexilliferae TaxID=1651774 RepID=A0ABS0AZ77_9BACT|nr:hypothetical protein [Candidatus Neptunochlamydia vexilliferae]MBF5059429.1 hypothetical protein [Candidatus Neptunochlamydia vexilliferae]
MNRRLIVISSCVVAFHLFVFFFNFGKGREISAPKQSMIVHTYAPPPPPKPKPQRKPAPRPRKKVGLNAVKEALSKIELQAPPEVNLTLPQNIASLQIDQPEKEESQDYLLLLAHFLKRALELPTYGEVKLELTVGKKGQVLKVHVLQAVSEKNRRYLERKLPQLVLPPFNEELKNENIHTFTLTFCNQA